VNTQRINYGVSSCLFLNTNIDTALSSRNISRQSDTLLPRYLCPDKKLATNLIHAHTLYGGWKIITDFLIITKPRATTSNCMLQRLTSLNALNGAQNIAQWNFKKWVNVKSFVGNCSLCRGTFYIRELWYNNTHIYTTMHCIIYTAVNRNATASIHQKLNSPTFLKIINKRWLIKLKVLTVYKEI